MSRKDWELSKTSRVGCEGIKRKMNLIYSNQPCDITTQDSIFLIGPTPRLKETQSWRPMAIQILKDLGYEGTVLIPEWDNSLPLVDYMTQVEWEFKGTENATILAAWVPRQMTDMPALTTNVEFGLYAKSGRIVYGRPEWAEHCSYLDWVYKRETGKEPHATLKGLLEEAVKICEFQNISRGRNPNGSISVKK